MGRTGQDLSIPLTLRGRTRAGWIATCVVCGFFGGAALWVLIASAGSSLRGLPFTLGLGGGYLWLAFGAFDVARSSGARLEVSSDEVTIAHPGLMRAPLVVPRHMVEAVTVDLRAREDRGDAASLRAEGFARPSFLEPSIPVVSAAVSSHSFYGTAVTPNLVLLFAKEQAAPRVPMSARFLLRVGQGRSGHYRGPRTGKPMRGVRLVVDDADAAARAFDSWGVLATLPRDARYLAPVTPAHRQKALRKRLLMIGGVAAISAFFLGLEILGRR